MPNKKLYYDQSDDEVSDEVKDEPDDHTDGRETWRIQCCLFR